MILILTTRGDLKKARCDECGCYFYYEEDNIHYKRYGSYRGPNFYMTCPRCKKESRVRRKEND